ncbi:alanine racemase [Candidatus Uhrbacteria bacterium]|nr:alanine racemase [Candidatus Uhrbacteria bacterium]
MHRSWVEISKEALRENIRMLRSIAGSDRVLCAVVKANAYGHGIREVARATRSVVDWFGVDSISEAITLRDAHIWNPVLVLGYVPIVDARTVARTGARVTVAMPETVRALAAAARSLRRTVAVHVKVETGTQRQGVTARELPAFIRLIERSRGLVLEGISTHLADVEDTGPDGFAHLQLGRFDRAVAIAERITGRRLLRHASASAGAMLLPDARFDLVRTGIALYGLWPSSRVRDVMRSTPPPAPLQNDGEDTHLALRPVLAWKTIVGPMHWVPAGVPVGYGCTERVRRRTRIAVLPVGYWDGYDRKLSSIGDVLTRGHRCKVIGRVCMNMMMVDVTDVPRVRLEDEVVLIGRQGREEVTADALAGKIGTINYEVVTRINPTLPRRVV